MKSSRATPARPFLPAATPCRARGAGAAVRVWLGRIGLRPRLWIGLALIAIGPLFPTRLAALNPARPADSYSIHGWFTEDGLPSNKIRAVIQARDGYLWLATAQGLARFDGSRFTTFTAKTHPELGGGGFFAAMEAPDGALWFGGDNGLFRWQNERFDRFTTEHGLAHNYVRALALTRDGAVVACTREGYSVMRGGRLTTPGGVWKQATGVARSYLERADGSILLGTEDGLWRMAGGNIERLSDVPGLRGSAFAGLLETPDGAAWIGFSGGLHCLRADGRGESYGPAEGLAGSRVTSLQRDKDGNLWIAASDGLFRLTDGRIEAASYPAQFDGTTVQQLHEGREGGLWVATAAGLFRLKDNVGTVIDVADGLAQTSVYAVMEARDGVWWIGVWNGGVYRYDGKRATRLAAPGVPGLEQITALAEAEDGAVWIGGNAGLYRRAVDGGITPYFLREQSDAWQKQLAERGDARLPGIAHRRVNAIAVDGEAVWAATDGALYRGSGGQFRAYTTADGLPGNVFKSVLRARNGDIWATVPPHGVARLRDGRWTVVRCGETLSPAYPRALYEDMTGAIWVTTEGGGLNRFKDGQWRTFSIKDGLAHDFISGVMEDNLQNLWVAYPRGIMRIPRPEFDELAAGRRAAVQPVIFDRFDGLPRGETNHQGGPNAWRARDGRVLFATDRGVAVIEPAHVEFNRLPPPVYIERLAVDGTGADLARPITVPPGTHEIEINYTAVSLLSPEEVKFKIRLEPFDREWKDAGTLRNIRYTELPPGDYTFRVVASNSNGVWNEVGAALAFTVRPFFYRTPWFLGLAAMAAAASGLGITLSRRRRAARQMATMADLVAERTRELQAAKERAESAVLAKNDSITALKRAQAEVAAERARFKFIFEAVPVGIAFAVPDDQETFLANPAHLRITGLSAAEMRQSGAFDRVTHPDDLARQQPLVRKYKRAEIDHFTLEKRYLHAGGKILWASLTRRMFTDPVTGARQSITTLVDITERKAAEAGLAETHRQLLDTSRQAGMAEVATSVLHNVGNVLNSVNVSTTLLCDRLRKGKSAGFAKVAALLREQAADLPGFFARDARAAKLPGYLEQFAQHLAFEEQVILGEVESLRKNVDHIKDIVAMQQSYATVVGITEIVQPADLVEDAVCMNADSLDRHDIEVVKEMAEVPPIAVDRHKVLQILINFLRNAQHACDESGRSDKRITVRVVRREDRVLFSVLDNGVGISPENLKQIFRHGFTTKKEGHGFGLHSSANAAAEMDGRVSVHSDGPGCGASFTLDLPFAQNPVSPAPPA